MTLLEERLRRRIADGGKVVVPYLVGGIPDRAGFPAALRSVAEHADAVEIGLPYSDPLMDGPVIAAAAERALEGGVGPLDALELAATAGLDVPRIAMTYYNPVHREGEREFCGRAASAGFAGLIVPDLPLEESDSLRRSCADHGLGWIPLVAPTSPRERVHAIAASATGFVYAASTLGVTGTREELSTRAARVVAACRAATDALVLVGIGISNAAQAAEAAATADGVVIGTAVVRLVLERGPDAARGLLAAVRAAVDGVSSSVGSSEPK